MNDDKLGFDETELNFILEAIVRFRQDIGTWGYVIPKGSENVDLTKNYNVALKDLQDKILCYIDGGDDET